jgi:hypothetical protein
MHHLPHITTIWTFGNSSHSTSCSNLTSSFFIKFDFASHVTAKFKKSRHPTHGLDGQFLLIKIRLLKKKNVESDIYKNGKNPFYFILKGWDAQILSHEDNNFWKHVLFHVPPCVGTFAIISINSKCVTFCQQVHSN